MALFDFPMSTASFSDLRLVKKKQIESPRKNAWHGATRVPKHLARKKPSAYQEGDSEIAVIAVSLWNINVLAHSALDSELKGSTHTKTDTALACAALQHEQKSVT